MMNDQNISDLLLKAFRQELTPEESAQLEHWLKESPENKQLHDEINDISVLMEQVRLYGLAKQEVNKSWAKMHTRLLAERPAHKRRLVRRRWIKYTAAAVLVACASLAMYVWWRPAKPLSSSPVGEKAIQQEVNATATHACLTHDDAAVQPDSFR